MVMGVEYEVAGVITQNARFNQTVVPSAGPGHPQG
jgi:hypothetical protein